MSPILKICGVSNVEDAQLVSASGADYCGILVDIDYSERSLSPTEARIVAQASSIRNVILMCNPKLEAVEAIARDIAPCAIQLQGQESPELVKQLKSVISCQIWKALHLPIAPSQPSIEMYIEAGVDALLVDSVDTSEGFTRFGGTGKVGDWDAAKAAIKSSSVPIYLAGGINPDNVKQALQQVRPAGIDLCSGVEARKGKKDPAKVAALVANFNSAVNSNV